MVGRFSSYYAVLLSRAYLWRVVSPSQIEGPTGRFWREAAIHTQTDPGEAALSRSQWELVRLNNQSDDDVYFLFSKTQADFQRMFTKRHMDRASPQSQALIHALQPYPGGDDDLRAIHDLDIIDILEMCVRRSRLAAGGL